MFKLQPNPTFWAPVSIVIPGSEEEGVIKIEFRHKTKTELKEFFSPADNKTPADKTPLDDKTPEKNKDLADMMEIVHGWEGVSGPFNEKNMAELLENYHGAAQSILNGYVKALVTAKQKN